MNAPQIAAMFAGVSRRCSPRPASRSIAKPASGHHPAFDPAPPADEPHRRPRMPPAHELLRDRDRRIGVPAGSATREHREDALFRHVFRRAAVRRAGVRRATLARMPAPSIVITSDEPPPTGTAA